MRVAVTVEQSWHVVPGGIATSTVELLRALDTRRDLDLVGVSAWHREPPQEAFMPPVPVRQLPLPRRALYEAWQWLRHPIVERATGPVDVVHDAGYVVPPSKAPLVATVHDLWFLSHPDHYTWHSATVMKRGLELARRHARLVMCPSRASIEACQAAGIDLDRLRPVPWGVRARPVGIDEATKIVRGYGVERPYVLFCGTIEQRKNVPRLLQAFEQLERTGIRLPGMRVSRRRRRASGAGAGGWGRSPLTISTPCVRRPPSWSTRVWVRGSGSPFSTRWSREPPS